MDFDGIRGPQAFGHIEVDDVDDSLKQDRHLSGLEDNLLFDKSFKPQGQRLQGQTVTVKEAGKFLQADNL